MGLLGEFQYVDGGVKKLPGETGIGGGWPPMKFILGWWLWYGWT